jgi:phosphinothricin acetyltransferase
MLRLAAPADAEAIQAIYAPFVRETAISFETEAPNVAEIARRVEETLANYPWLVWDKRGIGAFAYASAHRSRAAYQWSVDVSAYVAPGHQRRGIGRALYRALFEILAAQGFVIAHAGITLPNPASIGLHEAVGFRPLGTYDHVGFKLGRWHAVGWWQRRLREPPEAPQEPIALAELLSRSPAAVFEALQPLPS